MIEKQLANLLILNTKLTKEANSLKGETNKTLKNHDSALKLICEHLNIDYNKVKENL